MRFSREISRREGVSGAFSGDLSTEFSKSVDGFSDGPPVGPPLPGWPLRHDHQKDQAKITTSLRGGRSPTWQSASPSMRSIDRPGGDGRRTDCTTGIPFGHHGLRPRNDSGSGKVVRIRRGAVGPSVHTAERHGGRSLQGPIARRGDPCGRPQPHHSWWGAAASRPPYSDSSSTAAK